MTGAAGLRARVPLRPGTLRRVLAGVLLLSCAEFVRSGLYAGYLPQAASKLLACPRPTRWCSAPRPLPRTSLPTPPCAAQRARRCCASGCVRWCSRARR
ncbi:hypothetical protein MSS93_13855 [Deinococcus radiodurans]|nr:hypothetical protein MSS93_13855 [Deinococcus radiodurans]